MYQLRFLALLYFIGTAQCSVVVDSMSQKGIHLTDYCPKAPNCPEGAHVMCMYYDPNRRMGPRCNKAKNVTITPELAQKLLEVTNALRSKLVLGKERGKDSVPLPRGYGMHRLSWDSELATFAQVLANQCVLRHDLCRSSKSFPRPGQTTGLVRFSYPDWIPVSKSAPNQKPGLTPSKLSYAITQVLRSWYWQKAGVTVEMIKNHPDWSASSSVHTGRLYMEMIYGPATHMGCGISAYTDYAYYDNNAALNYNSVQIICNYSARGKGGEPAYQLDPPTEVGYTIKCGCPLGTEEDENCLCYEIPQDTSTLVQKNGRKTCSEGKCKPNVVLLPIFTIENAPSEKLISRPNTQKRIGARGFAYESVDAYRPTGNISVPQPLENLQYQTKDQTLNRRIVDHRSKYIALNTRISTRKPWVKTVRNRFFDSKSVSRKLSSSKLGQRRNIQKKKSIFSNVPTFYLSRRTIPSTFRPKVKPRRDFTNAKSLVNKYVHWQRENINRISLNTKASLHSNLSSAEEKVMNYNYYLKNNTKFIDENHLQKGLDNFETYSYLDSKDENLMHLLDKLEQEVKHIELDNNKREIFDAKIRKIYGTVLGKPVDIQNKVIKNPDRSIPKIDKSNKYSIQNQKNLDNEPIQVPDKIISSKDGRDYAQNIQSKDFDDNYKSMLIGRQQDSLNEQSDLEYGGNFKKTKEIIRSYVTDSKKEIQKNRNLLNGEEDIKPRLTVKENEGKVKSYYSDNERRRKHNFSEKRKIVENYEEPLSADRRKYYQNKLEELERKLRATRFKHRKEANKNELRPLRPATRNEEPLHTTRSRVDSFYVPDRARFLHGF